MRALGALLLATALPGAAAAQTPEATVQADPALVDQSAALVALLDGRGDYDAYFSPSFRAAVPREKLEAIVAQLRASLGAPLRVAAMTPISPWQAELTVAYQRGTAAMRIAIDPAAPQAVTGLLVTGTTAADDSLTAIADEIRALPGAAGIGIYRIHNGLDPVVEVAAERSAPVGSAFKLWVLAEAARQVAAGERRWADVMTPGPASLPSGLLQAWPRTTPVTLQTLAMLMISISDNTAADTLMTALGRARIDAAAARLGGATPVLTTREAFVLKGDAALADRWRAAMAPERRRLLDRAAPRIAAAPLDMTLFAGKPIAVDSIEWFASPRAMATTLVALCEAGPVARSILAVNPGVDAAVARRFRYLGFKGGSEPGVIALNFLAETPQGERYVIAANWHRSDAPVEEFRFVALVSRALALLSAR